MALFLFLVLVAVILGLIGVVAHGLFYLLIIGIVVLVLDVVYIVARGRRRRQAPLR
ncbi:hypothetical protein ACFYXS_06420 [Streptomyces sp. NPDC002574]|uniref:hypothetical protein n=1 Tax=Streptomyces sp. NPDC002574 TaxID=3364652 RepID=UPI0036AA738D